jgi:hypothetical protein
MMNYYINLFSPFTYERFSKSDKTISGFRDRQKSQASRIHPGDKLICYMTKLSRWVGVFEVLGNFFIDDKPIFSDDNDIFVVRFKVNPICWLPVENSIPIHDERIWNELSFTKELEPKSIRWTGKVRASLTSLSHEDGTFLEQILIEQNQERRLYPIDENEYEKLIKQKVKREKGEVAVTVPDDNLYPEEIISESNNVRTSSQIQSKIAIIGETLGFKIWIPRNDRNRVLQNWNPSEDTLMDSLPLNYDDITLRTIEQIDVIWLKRRSIIRAFEIEHTTAVYSGILRMADLLALQPNMDINLHIVAPESRRDKVFQEIQRPVFSLLDKGPLSEICSFFTYESINQISSLPHLSRMKDSLVEDYEEFAE